MDRFRLSVSAILIGLSSYAGLAGESSGKHAPGSKAAAQRYDEGSRLQAERKFAEAATVWLAFRKEFPQDPISGLVEHNLGTCALETGQLDLAIEAFENALKTPLEKRETTLWNLAIAFSRRGEKTLASADFEKAAELFRRLGQSDALAAPAKASADRLAGDFHFSLAELAEQNRKLPEAQQRYEAFLKQFPSHPKVEAAKLALVDVLAAMDQHDRAEMILETLYGQKDSAHPDYILHRWAELAFAKKRYADAAQRWGQLTVQYPTSKHRSQAMLFRGEALEKLGKTSDALAAYAEIRGAAEADALWRMGRLWEKEKQPEHALAAYERLLSEHPKSAAAAGAVLARAELLLLDPARKKDGLAALASWAEANPDPAQASRVWYRAAARLYEQGQYADALSLAIRARQASPEQEVQSAALQLIAQVNYQLQDYARADEDLAAFFKTAPAGKPPADAILLLARTKGRLGKAADALQIYERLLTGKEGRLPEPDRLRYEAVAVALSLPRPPLDRVKTWLAELADDAPKSPWTAQAHFKAAQHAANKQAYGEALAALKAALETPAPALTAPCLYLAGFSAAKCQRHEEAIDYFHALIEHHPEFGSIAEARFSLATAYQAAKRPTEARTAYQDFLQRHPNHPLASKARERIETLKNRTP